MRFTKKNVYLPKFRIFERFGCNPASPYFSFWQGLPFLKKINKTSTTRFLGSHRRALACDNITINKRKTFSLVFSNCYLIFFSLRGPFWNSPPDGDGSGNGQYAEVDRISLTASDRIVWQFSEFPTVPDPKNSSFQRPVPRGNFSGAESWFIFAVFALFKIKVSIILKMIHETITYRSKIVKRYVSPEERRYISIYYYYLLLLLLLLFSAFSILYITSFSIRTNRNNKKLLKERERFFFLFIPQASDRSSGGQENSPLERLNSGWTDNWNTQKH